MKEKINTRYGKLSEIDNFKQLNEDFETGKSFILDYKNNIIECNKFGIPIIKFNKNIVRKESYKSILNEGLIKELKNEKKSQYIPMTSRLLGSSMLPNPLSIPFINKLENSQKLIDTINKEEIFSLKKNKNLFNLKHSQNNNSLLPEYFCVKLGKDSSKTRNHLINLFEENIKIIKEENNNDPKYYLKNSKLIGLNNYKKKIKNNLTKNIFNGNKIPYTKEKDIFTKFRITKRLIKKEGWNKMDNNRQNINHDIYEKLYKIKSMNGKNNLSKKNNSLNISFENDNKFNSNSNKGKYNNIRTYSRNNRDKMNNFLNSLVSPRIRINKNKINSRQRIIFFGKRNINSSFKNESKNELYSINTSKINSDYNSLVKENKRDLYSPRIFHNFKRCLSDLNIENSNIQKTKNDENMINNSKKFKKSKEILDNCEHENKLLKGFESEPLIEELEEIGFKKRAPKFVSPSVVYKKEVELIKKVNPIHWERRRNKELFDDKMLLKKLEHRKFLKSFN